jgi:hypothetical protein
MAMSMLAVLLGAAQPAQPATPPKEKLVCRESEAQLGTHVRSGRRCKTQEQWAQEDAERDRVPLTLRVTAGQGDTPTRPVRQPQ